MSATYKWAGRTPAPVCAAFKKDLGQLQPWQTAERIAFRFDLVWCVFDAGWKMVLKDGSRIACAIVHSQEHGALIGSMDPYQTGLGGYPIGETFRAALDARNIEESYARLAVHAPRPSQAWDHDGNRPASGRNG